MTKKITAIFLALCMAIFVLPMTIQAASKPDIKVGDYVKMGAYNNASILWRCVSIDNNGPLMLADKIVDTLAYDAKTNDNSNSKSHSRSYKRDDYGSNYWKDSNMRSWLNSTAAEGKVDWLCGNPPKDGYVSGVGAYNEKAGFLNAFSKSEIAAMKTVTQRSLVSHPEYNKGIVDGDANSDLLYYTDISEAVANYDSSYFETTTEKVFLLDVKQANAVWKNLKGYYVAYNNDGMAWPYWLRTPVTDCNHDMRYISSSGQVGRYAPWYSDLGVRPAFYLDSEYFVTTSGSGSQSSPYIGSAPNKQEDDYTISEPAEDANPDWNVSTEQSIQLTLGPWYSNDGKYSNPTIPVYTIQKTRSDTENMVVVVCGEGYTKSQQGKFINDVKRLWQDAMKYEPYRSYADRFNVYALCTASESTFDNGGSTFFDVIVDKYNSPVISNNLHGSQWKNHIFERCIGPEFIEKIHDAHIKKKCDPNTIPSGSEYEPYYYVHDYIAQFAMVVNTKSDFGGAYNNREYGFHYFISPSDSYRASKTFAHEFGHGLLGLGDEYSNGYLLDDKELKSLNLSSVEEPEKIKWRQLLGFRNTYTCRNAYGSKMLVSSYECIMRDTNYQFCEVCRLQGFKRMSQLVKDVDLYVATPEVKEYTGAYSKPSDFTDLETSSYYNYTYNRNDRLLSGNSKSRFNTNMNGKKIELRTVIQNISDKNARQLKFKMWIKHSDGSVATDSSGNPLQTVQTFDIPVWNDKANFWPLGALDHIKSDFNSGLKSCSLIYQIPSDAQLKSGDTVAFQVLDENGNVLEETENAYYETFVRDNFDIFDCWIRNFREIGVRPWLSFRMNDVHGVAENETGMLTKFWQEHPETYRIHHHVPDGYFARTFDYEQQIVRDRMYAYIKEALERYDVDGVELDFMREMFCFAPGREFLCRDLMTDFVRSIRALCDEFEEKRGHRILMGIKLFALPHQVYDAGFDYFTYAEEHLIDVFIAGPRWETIDNDIPIEIWKKIFEPYGVKVAAGLELILRCHPHGEFYYLNTVETTMASATQYLSAGGDFTYLFNYMRPVKVDYSKDWVYSIYQTENYQRLIRNAGSYETSFPLPRRHVKTFHDIEPQWESAKLSPLPLTVAYDNTFFQVKVRACPAPKDAKCYVVLGAKGVDSDEISPETFDIYMNGVHLEYGGKCEVTPYTKWQGYYFPIPDPALVADGNVIEIARKTGAPGYSVEYAEIRVNAALEKDQWEKDHLVWIEL